MTREEIDEFLKAIKETDIMTILKYYKVEKTDTIRVPGIADENKILQGIVSGIEEGDFEYFLSKLSDSEYTHIIVKLMTYSSNLAYIQINWVLVMYISDKDLRMYSN